MKTQTFAIRAIYGGNRTASEAPRQIIFTNSSNPMCTVSRFGDRVGTNENATKELNAIMGAEVFSYPKPVSLIKYLISLFYDDSASEHNNDIWVLDFFAGSGTTAQAVLELNKDGGNRRFILCTNNENGICENITYPRIKTVITGKRTDGSTYSDGIKANLKYYRCDFVPRSSDNLSDALLKHIAEMIQIENGITLDGDEYIMLLTDAEVDALVAHWSEHKGVKALYVSTHVLLQTEQNAIFKGIEVHTIPEYYFDFDMKTAEEIW